MQESAEYSWFSDWLDWKWMGDGGTWLESGSAEYSWPVSPPQASGSLGNRAAWAISNLWLLALKLGGWSRHMGNGPASMEAHRIESPFAQVPTSDIPGSLLLDTFQWALQCLRNWACTEVPSLMELSPSWSAEVAHANGAHRRWMGIHGKQVCWAIMTWGWQLLSGKVGNWYAGLLGNNEQQRLLSYVEVGGNCYGLGSAPAIISQLPLTLLLHYLLIPLLLLLLYLPQTSPLPHLLHVHTCFPCSKIHGNILGISKLKWLGWTLDTGKTHLLTSTTNLITNIYEQNWKQTQLKCHLLTLFSTVPSSNQSDTVTWQYQPSTI